MPLKRWPSPPRVTTDWVEFLMEDTLTTEHINARVSYGALRKIGGSATSSKDELLAVFHRERERIEARASAKYVAGQKPPHLFPEDI